MYRNRIKKTEYQIQREQIFYNHQVFLNNCNVFRKSQTDKNFDFVGKGYLSANDFDFEEHYYFFGINLELQIFTFKEIDFQFESFHFEDNELMISSLCGDFHFKSVILDGLLCTE